MKRSDVDTTSRGLGGTRTEPLTSMGEENLLMVEDRCELPIECELSTAVGHAMPMQMPYYFLHTFISFAFDPIPFLVTSDLNTYHTYPTGCTHASPSSRTSLVGLPCEEP